MRPIYKLVPRFPGVLVPTYSEEEYQAQVRAERLTLSVVIPVIMISLLTPLVLLGAFLLK